MPVTSLKVAWTIRKSNSEVLKYCEKAKRSLLKI